MTLLSASQLEILRKSPQSTRLYLSIYEPQIVFKARINDGSIAKGEREITYDGVSLGSWTAIIPNATLWVGTTDGGQELGKIRIKSATSSVITVSENSNIAWQNDAYLTVFLYVELWPIFPRIIQNPSNPEETLWYKDYDIPYTNQNSVLGTYVNAGSHRAANLDPASGQASLYYSATGSYNLLGDSLNYEWWFQGATVTGSSSADPGYITYDTPGHYVTRLTISGSSGGVDTTYRYVSIYDESSPPIQKWEMQSLEGSRGEGGYSASFRVFETIPLQEHAVVVLFSDDYYGDSHVSLGGNYPNSSSIFWVGHIDTSSIQYDYEHSEVTFSAHSITQMMKESSGFSISVESVASPSQWYELLDMDGRRALYHYLRWHTTALQIADFQFVGDDYKIQFFDSNRESMYSALENYMRSTLIGQVVSDRQGKVWMETEARAYQNPTGSFPAVMDITNRDWMNSPTVEETLSESVSYMEYGGVAYSGVVTGTFTPCISAAPGNAPGFHGEIENHQGMALLGQEQLNTVVGNLLANRNAPFPSIEMEMKGNYSNLDIAPQEGVGVHIAQGDTVRNKEINGLYIAESMRWRYTPSDFLLLPQVTFQQVVNGEAGETVVIPDPSTDDDFGNGFNVPSIQIPPLPSLVTPSGIVNCADVLACLTGFGGYGLGMSPYSILFVSDTPINISDVAAGDSVTVGVVPTYVNNPSMYDHETGQINFLSTGTPSSVDIEISCTFTVTHNGSDPLFDYPYSYIKLIVSDYDKYGNPNSLGTLTESLYEMGDALVAGYVRNYHYNYTVDVVGDSFTKAGYKVVSVSKYRRDIPFPSEWQAQISNIRVAYTVNFE